MLLQGEWEINMKAKDLLDQESAGLTTLEASDKAILQKLADAEAGGADLTPEEVAEGQEVLSRIAALQAGDDAALASGTVTTPVTDPTETPGDGTGDTVPAPNGSASPVDEG